MKIKKLAKLHKDTEAFLLDYASGKYGNAKTFKITKKVVKDFMEKANEFDLEEALSYIEFKNEMLADLGTDEEGASDLEDWIKHVINKEEA